MNALDAFFAASDEATLAEARRALADVAHLELPCAVVHPAARTALARALGLDDDALERVESGACALIDGEVIGESELYDRDPDGAIDFGAHTCADAFAAHAPALVLRRVPADVRAEKPALDVKGVAYLELEQACDRARRLIELNAPEIILRQARVFVQDAFARLVEVFNGRGDVVEWQPIEELVTGAPPATGAVAPMAVFAPRRVDDAGAPCDARALRTGFAVLYPFATLVLDDDGALVDSFATCGMRPVGDDGRYVMFVCGGGPASDTGYFGAEAIVRDTRARAWVAGALPPGLPRYVAGTVGDVKWAIVRDVVEGRGYRTSRGSLSDQCGGTFNSACGAYAYDGGPFVLEASTGRPVLDARALEGLEVTSFASRGPAAARSDARAWRFLARAYDEDTGEPGALRLVDGAGALVRELADEPAGEAVHVLTADGARLLEVNRAALRVVDADTGALLRTIDLARFQPALALPADDELWRDALAIHGVAEAVARETPERLRAARADAFWGRDDVDDAALAALIARARTHPKL